MNDDPVKKRILQIYILFGLKVYTYYDILEQKEKKILILFSFKR